MRIGILRADDDVDLVSGQELAERTPARIVIDPNRLEQGRRARVAVASGMVDGALDPTEGGQIDPVFMGEMSANPHRGGHRIEGDAYALALDIVGRADASPAVDEDVAVPKH